MVVPFEKGPGKICGFALLDVNEDRTADQPFAAVSPGSSFPFHTQRDSYGNWADESSIIFKSANPSGRRPAEAGLAMLTAAIHSPPKGYESHVFAFFDLVVALDLQLQWTQSSMQPLPIVVCRDDERHRTAAAWQHLPEGRRTILIAQAAEPRVFRQAQLANARVFIAADLVRRVASTAYKMGTLATARRYAEPWPKVLRRHLSRLKPDEAAAFVDQLQLPPDAWAEFLTMSDTELIQHLRSSSQPQRFAPRAHLGNEIVVERDEGGFWARLANESAMRSRSTKFSVSKTAANSCVDPLLSPANPIRFSFRTSEPDELVC